MDRVIVPRDQRIRDLAKIKSLCGFAGNAEAETMIVQTLRACVTNLNETGKAYSFKGLGTVRGGNGLVDNPRGLRIMIERGWLVEQSLPDRACPDDVCADEDGSPIALLPTDKLLDDLERHSHR